VRRHGGEFALDSAEVAEEAAVERKEVGSYERQVTGGRC
jgi:hypothetical protein